MLLQLFFLLLWKFHFSFRIKFQFSNFRKTYLRNGILIDSKTTYKFTKNLKSIAIFNAWFQSLYRKKFSEKNVEYTYYYALLWTLQDEHTDNLNQNKSKIFELMNLAKADLAGKVPDPIAFEILGNKLIEMQLASKIQKSENVSASQLATVEEEKAGYSFPFYACLINFDPIPNQFQILYDFGVILQHIDDVLDIYEDTEEGIKTLANTISINQFEAFFNAKVASFIHQLAKLKASNKCIVNSFICISVGLVQIQNLKKQLPKSNVSNYKNMPREELICDFAKWHNLKCHLAITSRLMARYKSNSQLFE